MRILGIETSCDETAVAVVEDGTRVLGSVISSQREHFSASGGVIPEDAARQQLSCMLPVLHACLTKANVSPDSIHAIAVTKGPGLLGSLLVGTTTARVLAEIWGKPLIGVHHTLGHLSSTWLLPEEGKEHTQPLPHFPILTLSVSGGHSDLWLRHSHLRGTLLGSTRDDAAGEAFDKGASMLGLPYPGGPSIAKAAGDGERTAYDFPSPLHEDPSLDFSFSGLKTSLRYLLRDLGKPPSELSATERKNIAASYEHAICRHLIDRIERALKRHPEIAEVHIVGGVSANRYLRSALGNALTSNPHTAHIMLRWPCSIAYCTDNAAMIAAAGYFTLQEKPLEVTKSFTTEASIDLRNVLKCS